MSRKFHVFGPKRDGRAVGGRLDHVLAAAAAEAAADEGDRRGAPPGAEFADGVDEQDAARRARWLAAIARSRQVASGGASRAPLRRAARRPRRTAPDAAARGRAAAADACGARRAKDVERVLLFGLLRAAGEEDDVVVREAGELRARRRVRGLSRSVWAPSYLSEPVTWTRSAGAPSARNRSADSSFCAAIRSIWPQHAATSGGSGDSRESCGRSAGR